MTRTRITAALAAGALLTAAGCGGDAPTAGQTVYHHSEDGAPTSIDPLQAATVYSNMLVLNVYDTLYRYKYLARPYELTPNLAAAMPEISDDGLTYTIPLKEGVEFIDDEAFPNGEGREVVAQDFVYSLKRHFDPDSISEGAWLWRGKIEGMQDWVDAGGDYDEPVSGLTAVDDHTLRITLTQPFPQLTNTLAMGFSAIVPREAVEHHGGELGRRPVGSGPYQMVRFNTTRAVLEPNPKFRDEPLDLEREGYAPSSQGHLGLEALAGEAPPYVDRLEIDFIEEQSSRWASFTSGREVQYTTVPSEQIPRVLESTDPARLAPDYAERYHMRSAPETGLVFTLFNMDDPTIGYNDDPERERRNQELRCALRDAFSWQQRNERFYADLGIIFPGVIPPFLNEYDPDMPRDSVTQNLERARERLDEAGWNADNLPTLEYGMVSSSRSREIFEQFRGNLTQIGYPQDKIEARAFANFGDYNEAMRTSQLMVMGYGWALDYPDAENTLQLFYGPNAAPGSNAANYSNPEYDALYERASTMQPGPERTELYRRMNRMLIDDCVGMMSLTRRRVHLWHDEVVGLPDRGVVGGYWLRFVDIAEAEPSAQ